MQSLDSTWSGSEQSSLQEGYQCWPEPQAGDRGLEPEKVGPQGLGRQASSAQVGGIGAERSLSALSELAVRSPRIRGKTCLLCRPLCITSVSALPLLDLEMVLSSAVVRLCKQLESEVGERNRHILRGGKGVKFTILLYWYQILQKFFKFLKILKVHRRDVLS